MQDQTRWNFGKSYTLEEVENILKKKINLYNKMSLQNITYTNKPNLSLQNKL